MENLHIPTIINFYDFTTPRLNNLAFWLSILAIQIFVVAIAFKGGVSAGWTLYYPLSGADFSTSSAVSLAILSLHFHHILATLVEILVYLHWIGT